MMHDEWARFGAVPALATQGVEIIEHTADWSLRVRGRDLAQLLERAALGMAYLLAGDTILGPPTEERRLILEAYDAESLLVGWLSELAYWAEKEQLVFREFDLSAVTPTSLDATARGGRATELQKHIKAVTYHNLEIVETADGLEATIVFDV